MSRQRKAWGFALATFVAGFALSLWPLPNELAVFRPNWLAMLLCYWALERPGRFGLGAAFGLGLVTDLLLGTLLGEHALRFCVLVFIVLRFRSRLRFFTLLQQTLAILALLLNDRVVVLMIRGLSGEGWPPAQFWIAPLVGGMVWPWLFLLLDDLRLRWRMREPSK